MKEKGFTLIELLAVIVILAIIALIAVPIVLNIINDSKEQARERSAELYEKAVLNAVMQKQLDGKTQVPDGTYTVDKDGNICETGYNLSTQLCGGNKIKVEVEGERPEAGSTITIENGKVTDYSLTISGKTITPTNGSGTGGEKYGYMWHAGPPVNGPSINGDGSSLETTLPLDKTYYLKYKLDDSNKVTNAYACVKYNGTTERCLEGGSADTYGWGTNKTDSTGRVKKLYDIEQEGISGVSCSFSNSYYSYCDDGSVNLRAYPGGPVSAYGVGGNCNVNGDGSSDCDA